MRDRKLLSAAKDICSSPAEEGAGGKESESCPRD